MQTTTVGQKCCDSTIDAGAGGCTAWTRGEPWPWHGCALDVNHDAGRPGRYRTAIHRCKCGQEWGRMKPVPANYPDPATGRRSKAATS